MSNNYTVNVKIIDNTLTRAATPNTPCQNGCYYYTVVARAISPDSSEHADVTFRVPLRSTHRETRVKVKISPSSLQGTRVCKPSICLPEQKIPLFQVKKSDSEARDLVRLSSRDLEFSQGEILSSVFPDGH